MFPCEHRCPGRRADLVIAAGLKRPEALSLAETITSGLKEERE
jgi:hypothetical protein